MYDVPLEHYCARLGRNPSSNIKFEAFLRQVNAKHYIKDHFYVSLENNFENDHYCTRLNVSKNLLHGKHLHQADRYT